MKKNNIRNPVEKQTRLAAKRARRIKRKAKLAAMIVNKIRPLLLRVSKLQQEVANLRKGAPK